MPLISSPFVFLSMIVSMFGAFVSVKNILVSSFVHWTQIIFFISNHSPYKWYKDDYNKHKLLQFYDKINTLQISDIYIDSSLMAVKCHKSMI